MKNKKKNRISYSLSAELKNALKYLLIWGMILIFSAFGDPRKCKAAGKTGYLVYDRCGRKL